MGGEGFLQFALLDSAQSCVQLASCYPLEVRSCAHGASRREMFSVPINALVAGGCPRAGYQPESFANGSSIRIIWTVRAAKRHSSLVGSCGYLSLSWEKLLSDGKMALGAPSFSALCGCCCRAVSCAALKQLRICSQELSDRACYLCDVKQEQYPPPHTK